MALESGRGAGNSYWNVPIKRDIWFMNFDSWLNELMVGRDAAFGNNHDDKMCSDAVIQFSIINDCNL